MKQTTDKQLESWLDHYRVDTSPTRLNRLEENILESINIQQNSMFKPLLWKERAMSFAGACGVAALIVATSYFMTDTQEYPLLAAHSYLYQGY